MSTNQGDVERMRRNYEETRDIQGNQPMTPTPTPREPSGATEAIAALVEAFRALTKTANRLDPDTFAVPDIELFRLDCALAALPPSLAGMVLCNREDVEEAAAAIREMDMCIADESSGKTIYDDLAARLRAYLPGDKP